MCQWRKSVTDGSGLSGKVRLRWALGWRQFEQPTDRKNGIIEKYEDTRLKKTSESRAWGNWEYTGWVSFWKEECDVCTFMGGEGQASYRVSCRLLSFSLWRKG